MSLINDALKRATKLKGASNQLQPVFGKKQGPSKAVLIGGAAVVVGLAGWLGLKYFGDSKPPVEVAAGAGKPEVRATFTNAPLNNPITRASNTLQNVANLNSQGSEVAATMVTNPVVANPVAADPVVAPPVVEGGATNAAPVVEPVEVATTPPPVDIRPPTPFPAVRLQAIFFRTNNSIVRINGRSVRQGDMIDGVRIGPIEPASVQLEFKGVTKSLALQ